MCFELFLTNQSICEPSAVAAVKTLGHVTHSSGTHPRSPEVKGNKVNDERLNRSTSCLFTKYVKIRSLGEFKKIASESCPIVHLLLLVLNTFVIALKYNVACNVGFYSFDADGTHTLGVHCHSGTWYNTCLIRLFICVSVGADVSIIHLYVSRTPFISRLK